MQDLAAAEGRKQDNQQKQHSPLISFVPVPSARIIIAASQGVPRGLLWDQRGKKLREIAMDHAKAKH